MATELDTRIWIEEDYSSRAVFIDLVSRISSLEMCLNNWQNLTVFHKAPGSKLIELNNEFNINQLDSILQQHSCDADDLKYIISVSVRCWRFYGLEFRLEEVTLMVSAWGINYGKLFQLDSSKEGNAQISITNVGPYCGVNLSSQTGEINSANEKIEINLDEFIDLLLNIIAEVNPEKLMTFTDVCDYLPHNAHLVYYKNINAVVKDVNNYKNLLKQKSLNKNLETNSDNFWYHEWRNKEMQEELKRKLRSVASQPSHVDNNKVIEVLRKGDFDLYQIGDGTMILTFPYFLNNFLDELYIEFLE